MHMSASVISPVGSGHANEVVLKRLGAAAVCASRLERLIGEIARDVKVGTDAAALGRLRAGDFTVPPWASTQLGDITAWAAAAARLLSVRASVFAASGGARFTGTRGDTIATESADGSIFPADEEYLGRFVARLERHILAGTELHEGLDYRDEKGQRWPLVSIYRQSLESAEPEHRLRIPADWERWLSA
jgi:hypothetical protein